MKKILLLLFVFIMSSLQSFPYRLTRLVGPNGEIVNVFWEKHIDIKQLDPGVTRVGSSEEPKIERTKQYTIAEKMLKEAIKNLNNKPIKGPVDLIWELNNDIFAHSSDAKELPFLGSAGIVIHQEAKKMKNINFVSSDNLRFLHPDLAHLILAFIQPSRSRDKRLLNYKMSDLTDYLNKIIQEGTKLLDKTKNKLKPDMFKKLHQIWQSTSTCITNVKEQIGQYNQNAKIGKSYLQLNSNEAFISNYMSCVVFQVADFEMLTNILISNKKYIILYAGGRHSHDVIEQLISFGYKKVLDIGISPEGNDYLYSFDIHPILSAAGVRFILQEPRKTHFKLLLNKDLDKFINAFKINNEQEFIRTLKNLERLVRQTHVDLFNMQYDSKTLLHHAIENNWNQAVEILLDQSDISIDIPGYLEYTPLHWAIINANSPLVAKLLKKGASRHTKAGGLNALHIAARHQNDKAAELLLHAGSRINEKDQEGKTALHYAAAGSPALVKLFLESGANDTIADNANKKAIQYANTETKKIFQEVNRFKKDIHQAVENNEIQKIKHLLQQDFNPNTKDSLGRTPLHHAIDKKNLDAVNLLLKQQKINPNAQDNVGRTPLHYAIHLKWPKGVTALVQRKANINAQDNVRQTPLHYAARNKDKPAIVYLLQKKANPNMRDLEGKTPKEYAPQLFRQITEK